MPSDLEFALELADVADAIALPWFRSAELVVETKPDRTPVTVADRQVERALRERIASDRPGEAVAGEELGQESGSARWIVDPIDGTKNYVRGIPVWATLIGFERDGETLAAVASAPAMGRRWWASRGGGAFTTDAVGRGAPRRLRVSAIDRLEDAQLCHGGLSTWRNAGMLDRFLELSRRCWRTRGFGDFWMHLLVAEGSAEIAAELQVNLWDLAAVKLILEEARGRLTDVGGRATAAGGSAVSSNGLLHDEALRILASGG